MEKGDQVQKNNNKKYITKNEISEYLDKLEKLQEDVEAFESAFKKKCNRIYDAKTKLKNKLIEYKNYLQKTEYDSVFDSENKDIKKLTQEIKSFSNLLTDSISIQNDDIMKLMKNIIKGSKTLDSNINSKDTQKSFEKNNKILEIKTYNNFQNSNKNSLNHNNTFLINSTDIRQVVNFQGNIPLFFGSIITSEPSYLVNYNDSDKNVLIGFKNGSISIGQFQEKQIGLSAQFQFNLGEISCIYIFKKGKLCGNYLICAGENKTLFLVNPYKDNDFLNFKSVILARLEIEDEEKNENNKNEKIEEESKEIENDDISEDKVQILELENGRFCVVYKNKIFLWQHKSVLDNQYILEKIVLNNKINSVTQGGNNKIIALISILNLIVIIDLESLNKTEINLKDNFNITLCETATIIQLSKNYFLINNDNMINIFKYEGNLTIINSINKNYTSNIEGYEKINFSNFLVYESYGKDKWFNKYKLSVEKKEVKFELIGGPFIINFVKTTKDFCVSMTDKLLVIEKDSNKLYVFKV